MKKTALFFAGLMGLIVSGTSAAQQLNPGNNDVLMTDCSLLANDITLVMSANVVGGFSCNEAQNIAAVSTCHQNGQTNERSSVVTTTNGVATCTITSTEDCVSTVSGASFPTASTTDGTVLSEFPGSTCSAANAESTSDTKAGL
jgi:hypothetical protein